MTRAADVCTALRVLLAPLLAWQLGLPRAAAGTTPLLLYALAAVTDYLDGRLARASGSASPRGRVFDHGADALVLFPAFAVLAWRGRVPTVLPVAAVVAFALYLLDGCQRGGSWRRIELTASRSGALGGVLNYGVVGAACAAVWLDAQALDAVVYAAAYGVAAVNLAAAFERLPLVVRSARASRAGETEPRARHSSP
jgi:phosphatidylglycerophosphate synthase